MAPSPPYPAAPLPAPETVARMRGGDRMQWESDVGPFPQHIACAVLVGAHDVPLEDWCSLLVHRLGSVRRLRRRPVRPPWGGGSWVWQDEDGDPAAHVTVEQVTDSGDPALLDAALRVVGRRLERDRAPWHAYVLADAGGAVLGLVLVFHHALLDGLSGLTVLGAVVDEGAAMRAEGDEPPGRSRPPSRRELAVDAWRTRLAVVRSGRRQLAALRDGWAELSDGGRVRAPRSALNRPTGPRRQLAVVSPGLDPLIAAAHRNGVTLNDLLLVAVVDALTTCTRRAGESPDHLVVSVPVAVTDPEVRSAVGNADGAVPIPVPTRGSLEARLRAVASVRSQRLAGGHGRSLPLILAAFRVLSTVGLVGWFLDHQRLVNTLLTNLRGPDRPLHLLGVRIRRLVPIVPNQGNQTVSFAVLSYDGVLTVAVTSDPDHEDAGDVARRVEDCLSAMTAEV